jgi:hypothetical protein
MYKENYTFHTPDKSLTIWRYLDFPKFVDILLSSQLFFTRADKFQDPFEGVLRLKDHETIKALFSSEENIKQYYFLNCWHINETQSDAMWKIFLDTKNGIAIKSTVGDLITSLEVSQDDIYIGEVYYRDFDKVTFNELLDEKQNIGYGGKGYSINQFNYKRISFEHEKELRLSYIDVPIPGIKKDSVPREPLSKKRIDISVTHLINEVVIAPFADDWFVNLVKQIIIKLNYKLKVSKSDLYKI